ncbi:hypothetical protein FRB96_009602 [Tulasnella sp. 330]|nr:hypothetical protein FRB96_009602 [Tulasnella sp. 330]KAG8879358.1 hypothetical protein FRB97_001743 [Tulasnella sp. 331]KAG8883774.1 hypothetical protein FRB98_002816 [Tulasnella sp. 332]
MEVELTRHNVLSRGYTPPPEEKVAFYVYNQKKVAAERPPSNPSTQIIRDYSNEPVAWAPELPPDWHSQAVPPQSHQVSAHPTGNQSSQNLASLRGMTGNKRFQASPDRDFADLEREVMGEGSEVDYDVKSDTQEQSMGVRTPMARNAHLVDVASQSQAGRSARGGPGRGSEFGYTATPSQAARVPLPEASIPGTPRTTGIHIQIQPPTDPALSKVPSLAPSRTPSRTQRSRMEPSVREDRSVRSPSVAGTQRSRSHARDNSRIVDEEPAPPLPSPMPQYVPVREASPAPVPPTPTMSEATTRGGGKKSKGKGKNKMGPVMVETKYSPSGHVESVTVKMDPTPPSARESMYSDVSEMPPPPPPRERKAPTTIAEEEIAMPIPMPAPAPPPPADDSIAGQWAPIAQEMRAKQRSIAGDSRRPPSRSGSIVPPQSPQGDKPLHPLTNILRSKAGSPTPSQMTHSSQRQPMSPTRMRESMVSPSPSGAGSRHTRVRSQDQDGYDQASLQEQLEALERMEGENTPTASRAQSPQQQMVPRLSAREAMDMIRTPRTSYSVSPSVLANDVAKSHHHDDDLCVLLHAADDPVLPDVVKKAVRKAVKSRLRKLGVDDEDQASCYRRQHMSKGKHNHRISYADTASAAPGWAKPLFELLEQAQERLDRLDHKIDASRDGSRPDSASDGRRLIEDQHLEDEDLEHEQSLIDDGPSVDYEAATPKTPHVTMPGEVLIEVPAATPTQRSIPLSAMGNAFRHGEMAQDSPVTNAQGTGYDPGDEEYDEFDDEHHLSHDNDMSQDGGVEEETYRLKNRDAESQFEQSIRSERPLPEIPGSELGDGRQYTDGGRDVHTPTRRAAAPAPPTTTQEITPSSQGPAFARPQQDNQLWAGNAGVIDWNSAPIPSWQRVHQRLLSWTIVWSMSELERALESTERGHQVDECALTVWTTQCYKRYVRSKTVDNANPQQNKVDRLFVPPNVADAINSAVYNGRHGDACSMLKDMWAPFGFDGMPRLLIVLARHRRDANHWVVHRFSIPEGTLSTYDTYPERSLADGRPLGWWFAIRAAWPHAMYPNPDHLVQKLVRIHRPMQLLIDNSVAAAAIWRNLLMGSKAERSVDLIRMRDLINTEVRALKVRKDQGKLALPATRGNWEEGGDN